MDSRKNDITYLRRKVMLNKLDNNYLTIFDTAFKMIFKDVYLDKDNSYDSVITDTYQYMYSIDNEIVIEYTYGQIWYSYNDLWLPIRKIIIDDSKDFNERMFLVEQMHLLFEIYLRDYLNVKEEETIPISFPCAHTMDIWKKRYT